VRKVVALESVSLDDVIEAPENWSPQLKLMVHPIVLGSGNRLLRARGYRKALKLVGSKTFGMGVLHFTYRLAGRVGRWAGFSKARAEGYP
jgi:hypothetical protein